jgi:DNA-binding MarR family transcriptional regulator
MAGPLSTTGLSRLLSTTPPTVSSVLNTLERRGLLERRAVAHDRRAVSIALTDAGRAIVAEAFVAQHGRERAWVADLPAEDLAALLRTLGALANRPRPPARPAERTAGRPDDELRTR